MFLKRHAIVLKILICRNSFIQWFHPRSIVFNTTQWHLLRVLLIALLLPVNSTRSSIPCQYIKHEVLSFVQGFLSTSDLQFFQLYFPITLSSMRSLLETPSVYFLILPQFPFPSPHLLSHFHSKWCSKRISTPKDDTIICICRIHARPLYWHYRCNLPEWLRLLDVRGSRVLPSLVISLVNGEWPFVCFLMLRTIIPGSVCNTHVFQLFVQVPVLCF